MPEPRTSSLRPYLAELVGTMLLVVGGGRYRRPGRGLRRHRRHRPRLRVHRARPGLRHRPHISGCHVNPAVTLGLLVARKISPKDAAGYVVAQLVGALAGAGIVYAVATGRPGYSTAVDGLGTNGFGDQSPMGFSLTSVLVTEVVATAILVFVVLATTDRVAQTAFAGIPIGLTLVVLHLLSIGVDSTSVNPARSFGPALIAGGAALSQLWVFVVAPLVGAVVAAVVHEGLFGDGTQLPSGSSAVSADPAPPQAG